MRAIGVPLRKWTLCLLLLCVSTWAEAQAANEVAASYADATAGESTTTHTTSTAVPLSKPAVRHFELLESTCPFRTINYITHTLPHQCAKTSWSAPVEGVATVTAVEAEATLGVDVELAGDGRNGTPSDEGRTAMISTSEGKTGEGEQVASGTIQEEPGAELETDSPLDNANFLSFEEWKMKNLAQVGQSPENVGQGRAAPSNQPARRRPVNVNALDSLGEEAEIELDFSGFGTPPEGHENGEAQARGAQGGATTATEAEKKAAPSSWALSKDAGKTCKERFNYASFDCAATVLKTNKQAKSATSVLVENKDSYMLNVCSASNKFLIVELCDDILVDTVVLANYEFFSSMFRHFRVSVSDRYPVKMERWRTLATFEARNSRDIQPFLITEPQIWARYLRIEFLTQYGNEFYCPLSLLRVHGTTMMEQFRREEEEARGVDDDVELEIVEDVVKPAIDSGPIPPEEVPVVVADTGKEAEVPVPDSTVDANSSSAVASQSNSAERSSSASETSSSSISAPPSTPTETPESHDMPPPTNGTSNTVHSPVEPDSSVSGNAGMDSSNQSTQTASSVEQNSPPGTQATASDQAKDASTVAGSQSKGVSNQVVNDTVPSKGRAPRSPTNSTASNVPSPPQQRPSGTSPTPPAPSTQESFFKSIHKRLLYLEANSTLSLQYIEEQSRILRDAFVKVEKRQLAKTEKFLDHLNSTVMQELKSFRMMYDQLWQSTVIEIESMKERQKSEMSELGTRLSLMADELVWQKRMAVVQSTLLLLCLGLVLFVRSGTLGGNGADVPIVQQLGNKYSSFFDASSPPRSPPDSHTTRRRRTFRNIWRSDTSLGLSDPQSDGPNIASDADTDGARSPVTIEYRSATPTTASALAASDLRNGHMHGTDTYPPDDTDQAARLEVLETQSGPATPNGTRDSRPSWEEVDRAIDALKADEEDSKPQSLSSAPAVQPPASSPSASSSSGTPAYAASRREREKARKKRSPLRRAHSSYDGVDDGSEIGDSGSELFL